MINTIIFDVGRVLVDFCWEEMLHGFGLEGADFEKVAAATVRNPAWNEFDRGIVSTEEIIEIFAKEAAEYKPYIAKIFEDPSKMIKLYDYAIPWILELKEKGYRVYILSNWSEPTYHACKDSELCFLQYVDGAVFSFQEHLIKPEKEIFQLICERYAILPQEAVFLDDTKGNIISAKAFGLHGIHFQSYEQAHGELEALLAEN